jgi:hypothetical protein
VALTKTEMEKMAADLRAMLGVAPESPLDPFKIGISGVKVISIDEVDGLETVCRRHLEGIGRTAWSAMTVPVDDEQERWVVVINKSNDIERQRVSLLEELWHIMQGHDLTRIVKVGSTYGRSFDSDSEHDAYYLASATLLPESSIRKAVAAKKTADDVARAFGVSKELVEYRIKRLNLWSDYKGREIRLNF